MIAENLLTDIGFTVEEQDEYLKYREAAEQQLAAFAEGFMNGKITFTDATAGARSHCGNFMHEYTADLLFVLECSGFLLEKYEADGLSRDMFINSMQDIKYKLDECKRVKNVFGTFVAWWYEDFLSMKRMALGRLQYDIRKYDGERVVIQGYEINTGDFILGCHIPSAGPLTPELCMDSFKRAYTFFRDRLKENILPIICHSWLLYPPYEKVFGEKSNTVNFARYFEIIDVKQTEKFSDAWRVFGMGFEGDTAALPNNTSMQRNFIDYIGNGEPFGDATGIILFDGERALTRR